MRSSCREWGSDRTLLLEMSQCDRALLLHFLQFNSDVGLVLGDANYPAPKIVEIFG